MKKFSYQFLSISFLLLMGTFVSAQNQILQIYKNGNVIGTYEASQIDSIKFIDNSVSKPVVHPVTKAVFSGYVQKGPYVNGSSVTITPLDEQLDQTGNVFSTQIIDNSGNFERKNVVFASNFVELKADGYYFNEVKGENSTGSLTLYALADISDVNSVNVNILTHLERRRIFYLIQNTGLSFPEAKKQARKEVLGIFKFALPENVAAESLDLAEDVLLLAVSVIVQGQLSSSDMSELLANISSDIRADGRLDNPALGAQLMNNVAFLDLDKVKSNIEKRYSGLGIMMNVNIDELKSYIKHFKDNCGFEQTLGITYPKTGKYGPNILADGFVEAKRTEWSINLYSMRAELPPGNSSLKIVIKTDVSFTCTACGVPFREGDQKCPACGNSACKPANDYIHWGGYHSGSEENWLITQYDFSLKGNTFTVYESGKPADVTVTFLYDFIIEYYENGATIPTKVKKVIVRAENEMAEDDEHEREMLIAFYQSTNGNNWIKKDNWCSNKPISQWYGIETWNYSASGKSCVRNIELPNNNLTGNANLTGLKSIYGLNILSGNKIESLTINNCGNEIPQGYSNKGFYHDEKNSPCNLKALNISNTNASINVNGNFSAETVTVSNCNLSGQQSMYFNSPSTKIGTLTVSGSTMGTFYADNSIIGNITIDNCTFVADAYGNKAYIYVGNKTTVNNCKGLQYIYSKQCSDLTVTNTVCNDIRCGN